MFNCVICGKTSQSGIPRWVIDWDVLQVIGQAHTGCVRKNTKYQDTRFAPLKEPNAGQLAFTAKLRRFILSLEAEYSGKTWSNYEFHQFLLANEALFNASTREEWANLERVKRLTDWWLNGSKIISQKEYDSLFEWISSFDTHELRSKEVEK